MAQIQVRVFRRGGHQGANAPRSPGCTLFVAVTVVLLPMWSFAADAERGELERQFADTVKPFVATYCVSCHGAEKPKAQLNLGTFASLADVTKDHAHWMAVKDQLTSGEMPPEDAKRRPTDEERKKVAEWIEAVRRHEASRNAGDPGPVLARRLSNVEYDYTIRDLTGVDLRPTREFPLDPANQAGFDNSGESLTMSPALFKKYLQAARQVADHLVLKPDGFDFASHPVLAETDRDKYSILRIVDFYKRQPTDYADYFLAAWRYRYRKELGRPDVTLAEIAAETRVSAKYLDAVWKVLTERAGAVGPIVKLQTMWNALPAADGGEPAAVRAGCEEMRNSVVELRKKVAWRFRNLELRGVSSGGQCFIGWKNRQYASHRRMLNPETLEIGGVPRPRPVPERKKKDEPPKELPPAEPDPELFVPVDEAERVPYIAAFEKFCDVFPDAFYVSERGRMHLDRPEDKGRFLSAGFHNMMGYFRDDTPLMEMILDDAGRRELDRLWVDFDFVAFVPERQHAEFIFYERAESSFLRTPEFDFARSEDKDVVSETKLNRLAEAYLAKARKNLEESDGNPMVLDVIADHFRITSANIRAIEKLRAAAEPKHLDALVGFVERAYRRPLEAVERDDLLAFYRRLRERDGLSHEDAIRDSVVSALMSPHFCYRVDLLEAAGSKAKDAADGRIQAQPLSDLALASRLSYFLWSSMPDEELLAVARAGELHRPEVIAAQARRMMRDARIRGWAVEFGGNWLDFRRFEEHNAVDRERFPTFNDELRQAMFEEPVRFLVDVVSNDRPALDVLYGKHTFVNTSLAIHYGMPHPGHAPDVWVRVDDAERFGRGGLLPMAVFQTKNAPGLRTSPVKRGYWVVRRLLGEVIPPPPPVVPELPADEANLGELTLRDALARHRADKNCAACHARFDSFGLVFEGFGPVGERREKDLGGKVVDTRATFPDGSEQAGLEGLRTYIKTRREDDFVDHLSRQLLAYALGRSLILSDDGTIARMQEQLQASDGRFGSLIETIVTSPQFLNKRASDELATR
jgi:cytochrome c553